MSNPTKADARRLVTALLHARRNGNVKHEQHAYDRLRSWCNLHNVNMQNAIVGVTRELAQRVAPIMNSIIV